MSWRKKEEKALMQTAKHFPSNCIGFEDEQTSLPEVICKKKNRNPAAAYPILSCLFPCRCIARASQYVFVFCPAVSCVKRRNVFSLFIASASPPFVHPVGILKIDALRSISVITRFTRLLSCSIACMLLRRFFSFVVLCMPIS